MKNIWVWAVVLSFGAGCPPSPDPPFLDEDEASGAVLQLEPVELNAGGGESAQWRFLVNKPPGTQVPQQDRLEVRMSWGSATVAQVSLSDEDGEPLSAFSEWVSAVDPGPGITHEIQFDSALSGCTTDEDCQREITVQATLTEGPGTNFQTLAYVVEASGQTVTFEVLEQPETE